MVISRNSVAEFSRLFTLAIIAERFLREKTSAMLALPGA